MSDLRISMVKKRLLSFIMFFIKLLNYLIPKKYDQIMFESFPDFSDNPKALYDYISSKNQKYKILWAVNEVNDKIDVPQYKMFTLKRLWQFLRSKYIVTSHGIHPARAKNQVIINLWHGMPLKAMGYAQNNPEILPSNFNDNNYYLIATSTIMRNAIAACFNQDPRRIFVMGQPRNDKLFKGCRRNVLKMLGVNPRKYDRIVLFTPTFRRSDFIEDGRLISYNFNLPDFSRKRFQEFLKERGILCLVKFHPFEEKEAIGYFKSAENIKLIKTEALQEKFIDLYDILPCVDILVTDYSSVYFDFLLLDRPILFVVPDFNEYQQKRGFVLEPFEFWTPGPKVKNFQEFLKELERSIKNPEYYQKERKIINDLVNHYKDDRSSERVYKLIWGE